MTGIVNGLRYEGKLMGDTKSTFNHTKNLRHESFPEVEDERYNDT